MSIAIDHVWFNYGAMAVLRDIRVAAERGALSAVIGPNAAGKSTLLKCIIGALRPQRGRVLLNGLEVSQLSARRLAQVIAYVPQRSNVSAAFTVRQVIELGRYALPPSPSSINAAIGRLDLADVADRPFQKLSVGQQQRVTLARALAQIGELNGHHQTANDAQRVLVLDEPTSAMDLQHVGATIRLLREQANRGITVLMAMHDLSLAAAVADRIWLLDGGQIVADGPPQEVLTLERLRQVFRTDFQWIRLPDGSSRLLSDTPGASPPEPAKITSA